jgi:hypothetical protein
MAIKAIIQAKTQLLQAQLLQYWWVPPDQVIIGETAIQFTCMLDIIE